MQAFRWDKDNDPFAELNTPELDDTPIGRLRVVSVGASVYVCRVSDDDPSVVVRILHILKRNENPLVAIYGRRHWEQATVRALYDKQAERRDDSDAREWDALSTDFQREMRRIYLREDGDEIIGAIGSRLAPQ